ncbi:MAG: site-2 protease family protein [Chloroflexi bacterium]|nr:site-2 protease family protein [Chloroflexota bacterium]
MSLFHFAGIGLGLLIAITVHEFLHAWMANYLGDPTPRYLGRVSLNPIVHLDPLGTMMMVFTAITGFGLGWGKPVPVNPYNLRPNRRTGMALVALSGPLANLITASALAIPIRLSMTMPTALGLILYLVVFTNIGIAVFNLIPLPPLDGYSVLQGILASIRAPWAYAWASTLSDLESRGPMLLLLLIMVDQLLPVGLFRTFMSPIVGFFARLILG